MTSTLWYSRCPVPTASGLAIDGGDLQREFGPDGIVVRSLRESDAVADRLAHYTHDHPALFREGGLVPPVWARSRGATTRLLAVGGLDQFEGIVVRADAPIADGQGLRGARIGLARRSNAVIDFGRAIDHYGLSRILAAVGLDVTDAHLVDVVTDEPYLGAPPSERAAGSVYTLHERARLQTAELLALVRGEVDAVYTATGYGLHAAALLDLRVVVDASTESRLRRGRPRQVAAVRPWTANHLRVLTVSAELLDRRPDLVIRWIRSLSVAARRAAEDDAATWSAVAEEVGLARAWAQAGYHSDLPRHLHPSLDSGLLAEIDTRISHLHRNGFIDVAVDLDSWLEPDALTAAIAAPLRLVPLPNHVEVAP